MNKNEQMVKELQISMAALYSARSIATGILKDGMYPEMDRDTFDKIVNLQTDLTILITQLEAKTKV